MGESSAPEVEDRFMKKKTVGLMAAAGLVAGLALTSNVGAQDQGPAERSGPQAGAPELWFDGLGSSIGASVRDATAAELTAAGVSQPGGAFVIRVTEGGPAAKAGLMANDLVVEFDGEQVRSARHLVRLVRETAVGRSVKATLVRDKARRNVELVPTDDASIVVDGAAIQRRVERATRDLPRFRFDFDPDDFAGPFGSRQRLGVQLLPLSDQLASYFGVKDGMLVASVAADSPAAQAGLKAGDVITAVNNRAVDDARDVLDEISRGETSLSLTVVRDKKEVAIKATVPESQPRITRRGRSV
jgi:serine protease Do